MNTRFAAILCTLLPLVAFSGNLVEVVNAGFEKVDKDGYPSSWSRHPNWHGERAGHNGSGGMVFECAGAEERRRGNPRQEVRLEPGRRYRVSALVRTDRIVTERKTSGQGISIGIDCFGADGKWVFTSMARPMLSGTTDGWRKMEAVTKVIPGNVAHAYVMPIAQGCVSGRAAIDNVTVEEYDLPPVESVFPHAYRNESCGGPVRFSASINADLGKNRQEDYTATFAYVSSAGNATVTGDVVSAGEAAATLDTSLFAFGTNDVVCTLFLKGKKVGSAAAPFARVASPTPRRVRIDSLGRTIVDGRPFLPLGMYFSNGQATASNISVYADSPFNCVMPYAGKGPSTRDMDNYHRAGLKVIFDLRHGLSDEAAGGKWAGETVRKFRDHPALLAWYTNDERPVSDVPKLAARQKTIEALDPDHPTWSVQDVFSEVRCYLGTYDVLGMDPYPVPRKPIGEVISSMRQGISGTFGARAIWQVPQAFGWGWLKRRETEGLRAPTRQEIANMTWQSIAGGANGIVYYAYHTLSAAQTCPDDTFASRWERVKSAASEVKQYEDVILSDEPVALSCDVGAVAARAWRHEGLTYLLAVNCTTNAQTAAISFPEDFGKVAGTDFGAAPRKVEGRRAEFALEPMEYAIVRFK